MTTTITILNVSFAAAIFVTIVGLLAWAVATQSRDYGPIQARMRPSPDRSRNSSLKLRSAEGRSPWIAER
jgi:hypothetical protein